MRIMTTLHHPNIVNLRSFIPPTSYREFGDVLFVLDFVETNLRDLLDADKKLVQDSAQYIMFQLLSALNYIHSSGLVHGDVRPERMAVDANCNIKLGDIGVTYVEDEQNATEITPKMWYRAPEIIESHDSEKVTNKMDIFGAGSVMAEILGADVLFRGASTVVQAVEMQRTISANLDSIFQNVDPVALDLLKKLLAFDASERISAKDALRHEWLRQFFNENNEVLCDHPYDVEYEKQFNDVISIKRAAFDTILDFEQICRRATTPISRLSSPVQRADAIKRMQLRLNSPAVEVSQKDLISKIQHSVENNAHLLEKQEPQQSSGFISPREKKKSLFERMRDLFAKRQ
jgi:mitogen-activated protein kinase 1/3